MGKKTRPNTVELSKDRRVIQNHSQDEVVVQIENILSISPEKIPDPLPSKRHKKKGNGGILREDEDTFVIAN